MRDGKAWQGERIDRSLLQIRWQLRVEADLRGIGRLAHRCALRTAGTRHKRIAGADHATVDSLARVDADIASSLDDGRVGLVARRNVGAGTEPRLLTFQTTDEMS